MLEIGSIVDGKYKILNKVGQGGMSVVYLAMNEKANKQWAVKEVRKDGIKDFEVIKQGLVAETDILKKLSHPNLPSIIDVIDTDDSFIIIMDYIQGNSLNKALDEFGAQPQENVIDWAKQLCDVLGYLHSRTPPIIYRDMKPANIMLKPDGNVTLIDFGTAREFKEKNLADTTCLGTIGYAAPEQFGGMGQTDARTDIYCLGATLYHLVTGMNPCEPPYEIKPIRQINPSLSGGFERIIHKCTQKDPNDRYQSAAELMYALEHYEEIDDIYRKKQKKKLNAFITSVSLTVAFGLISGWGYTSAENKKKSNYDSILASASSIENYYDAIRTDPTRVDAYSKLNDYLISDYKLSKEEGNSLIQLQAGLDGKTGNGFDESINVLAELEEENYSGYVQTCFDIGWSFLSYYDTAEDSVRYENAQRWFEKIKDDDSENGKIASVFYNIYECIDQIKHLRDGKVIQTQELSTRRQQLWDMIKNLKKTSENYEVDYKVQTWLQIDSLIYNNIQDFLMVADVESLTAFLKEVQIGIEGIDNPNPEISVLIDQLKLSTQETITKIQTAKE